MKQWDERAHEIAYLLNPAFCGRILYSAIVSYKNESKRSLPFPLIYLFLPLVLHKATRTRINSRTQLLIWVQRNPELLIGFPKRAHDLVPITNEAIEFLLQSSNIELTLGGDLDTVPNKRILSKSKYVDEEISDCLKKSEHVAKWFARAGKSEIIYISLGVRP